MFSSNKINSWVPGRGSSCPPRSKSSLFPELLKYLYNRNFSIPQRKTSQTPGSQTTESTPNPIERRLTYTRVEARSEAGGTAIAGTGTGKPGRQENLWKPRGLGKIGEVEA